MNSKKCKELRKAIREMANLVSLHKVAEYDIITHKYMKVVDDQGVEHTIPARVQAVLKKMNPRALYQRAKRAYRASEHT